MVLETPEANLSAGMQWLNSGYNVECQVSAIVKWCFIIVNTVNYLDQLPYAET
ncbi:MAG: hypothetical protein LAO21_22140 [Acidobacteriia bacterium]|nr:hypothetical protein [Terriglobia bacterium]